MDPKEVNIAKELFNEVLDTLLKNEHQVSVYCGKNIARNTFDTALCVAGKLEGAAGTGKWRVLVNDGTYSYFTTEDIVQILTHPQHFKDGSKAVVTIKI